MASYVRGGGREGVEVRKKDVTVGSIGLYSVPRLICNPLTNVPPLVLISTKVIETLRG
jgi:hypothetical protein